jgi:hypothetical protein
MLERNGTARCLADGLAREFAPPLASMARERRLAAQLGLELQAGCWMDAEELFRWGLTAIYCEGEFVAFMELDEGRWRLLRHAYAPTPRSSR